MARNALNDFVNTLTALDAMPGGVVVYRADKGEEILYANKKLYEIYGCEDYDEFLLRQMELFEAWFMKMTWLKLKRP